MTKKYFTLAAVAVILAIIGIGVSWLGVVFGWTNPTQAPPQGSGLLTVLNGNLGVNTNNPTSTLSVNGTIDAMNNLIQGVSTPIMGTDAANKDYVDALTAGGGGGSMVLYYKTSTANPAAIPPSCPSGWTPQVIGPLVNTVGYGPHYLGILNYDWYNGGSGGTGGGFPAGGGGPPLPNGSNDSNYVLNAVAMGSDSLCSQSQTTVVPFSSIYNNNITTSFTSMSSDACFTNTSTGVTECNRCIICQK